MISYRFDERFKTSGGRAFCSTRGTMPRHWITVERNGITHISIEASGDTLGHQQLGVKSRETEEVRL